MTVITHPEAAQKFMEDEPRVDWHDQTLWYVRTKRDAAVNQLPEWETLRSWASKIKAHTLSNLDHYLELFEKNARTNGVFVHWAADAQEHNRIIYNIIKENRIKNIVKSKSMLTEECHLNEYLQRKGISIVDTDLGEHIIQLRKETPSHIVLPAIHLKKQEVSDTFHTHLNTEKGNDDPAYLTEAARQHLRKRFLKAEMAVTGVNFAVAENGTFVVCTNEGNADMGAHSAKIHVACMGIEKVIPEAKHLAVFLRVLARSATGQPLTTYSSHFTRPHEGRQMHIVIVDNGRSKQLGRPDFRSSLKCIRCAACFNTCPVYRKSAGHSYHATVAGPIGAILNPNVDTKAYTDLPFASTLCGSCTNVCPVKIDIHGQLWKWRQVIVSEGYAAKGKATGMYLMAWVFSSPRTYRLVGIFGRWLLRVSPLLVRHRLNVWYKQREMPDAPQQSFRGWFLKNKL